MTTLLALSLFVSPILAHGTSDAPIMLKIIFWILLLLWAIGSIGWPENPAWSRGGKIVLIILLAILGFYVLGF